MMVRRKASWRSLMRSPVVVFNSVSYCRVSAGPVGDIAVLELRYYLYRPRMNGFRGFWTDFSAR